jgi:hypothetical protein
MAAKLRLTYDDSPPHARKHRWNHGDAGFVRDEDNGAWVGKCSTRIDPSTAQNLLDDGIPWSPRRSRSPFPERVFNVFEGIPYRAHRQAPGCTMGFQSSPLAYPAASMGRSHGP